MYTLLLNIHNTQFENQYDSFDAAEDRLCQIINNRFDHTWFENKVSSGSWNKINGVLTTTAFTETADIMEDDDKIGFYRIELSH